MILRMPIFDLIQQLRDMGHITVSEFARRLGLSSRSTVASAIATGKLLKSVKKIKGVWMIVDEELAMQEWALHYKVDDARANPKLRAKMKRAREQAVKEGVYIRPPEDDIEIGPGTVDGRSLKLSKSAKEGVRPKSVSDAILASIKAEQAELELEEKRGSLVKREEIDRALFAAGQEIRESFLTIPDRVIDNILACDTRAEAHAILMEAIATTLERLADPKDMVDTKLKTA